MHHLFVVTNTLPSLGRGWEGACLSPGTPVLASVPACHDLDTDMSWKQGRAEAGQGSKPGQQGLNALHAAHAVIQSVGSGARVQGQDYAP